MKSSRVAAWRKIVASGAYPPMPIESAMYELLEHTADVRARLWAPDLAGLYASAVDMVRDVLVGESRVEERTAELAVAKEQAEAADRRLRAFTREVVPVLDGFLPK